MGKRTTPQPVLPGTLSTKEKELNEAASALIESREAIVACRTEMNQQRDDVINIMRELGKTSLRVGGTRFDLTEELKLHVSSENGRKDAAGEK